MVKPYAGANRVQTAQLLLKAKESVLIFISKEALTMTPWVPAPLRTPSQQQQPQPVASTQNAAAYAGQTMQPQYQTSAAVQLVPQQPQPQQQQYQQYQQPTVASQQPGKNEDGQNDSKIDNVFGKDIVMDWKVLFTAPKSGYASVYGKPSVVTVTITRFGAQGTQSVTVKHNIAPCIVEKIEQVAGDFAFKKASSATSVILSGSAAAGITAARDAVFAAITALTQGQVPLTINDAANLLNTIAGSITPAGNDPDFYFQEVKVNSHKIGQDGFAPVSTIEIQRQGLRNGEPARYPWIITIDNFEAFAKRSQKGTVTYDSKTRRNQPGKERPMTIMASDKDIYELANKARHFIDAWTLTTTSRLIKAAKV